MAILESKTDTPAQPNFRGHIAELDGLRAVGICIVLLGHFWPEKLSKIVYQFGQSGWIAVDCFFVLSGFLITGILLDSRDKPKYYSTFWTRRALRIFPLYYLVLLMCWVLLRFTDSGNGYRYFLSHWGSPMWFTFYLGNIRVAMKDAWAPAIGYGPLWTLQMEEQFYFLFPLAVALLRREHLRKLLIAAAILSPVIRVLMYLRYPNNAYIQYILLPCHSEGLALGGLIALRFRRGLWAIRKLELVWWAVPLIGIAGIASIMGTWNIHEGAPTTLFVRLAGYSISSAGCACLVLALICFRGSSATAWLRTRPLQYLGKISYGLYMLHPIVWWVMLLLMKKGIWRFRSDAFLTFVVSVGLSLVSAAISWECIESPFMKLKDRFKYRKVETAAGMAPRLTGTEV